MTRGKGLEVKAIPALKSGTKQQVSKSHKTLTLTRRTKDKVMIPESPFSKTDFHKADEPFKKKGSHVGLLLPNGQVLINFADTTSQSVLSQIAKTLGAELISVSGTWTFEPDSTQGYKIIARGESA